MPSTDPTESNWNKEWKLYNQHPYFKPNHKVIQQVKHCFGNNVKGKKIIELGAGSGSDIISLTQDGAEGYALDFSQESLKSIQYWAQQKQVSIETIKADIKRIPFPDNYFDAVYSVGLMEHFTDPISLIQEQIRVLKPGGFLIIDVPQTFTLYTIAKHWRMWRGTHPFGWETEYSKPQLIHMAKKLDQQIHHMYGRDSDIIFRLPDTWTHVKPYLIQVFSNTLEKTFLAPYICLCIGLVMKIEKK
jgi:ubiquinone/menaquinone biosynthesis C-methylase UbiE